MILEVIPESVSICWCRRWFIIRRLIIARYIRWLIINQMWCQRAPRRAAL